MIRKVLALTRFKYMPMTIFQFPSKRHSDINIRHCSDGKKTLDTALFDTVDVQKYLHFITKQGSQYFQSKEVEQISKLFRSKEEAETELKILQDMPFDGDKELEKLITLEKEQCLETIQHIKREILVYMLSYNDKNDTRNVELQILSGIGGEESKLFSKELFQMYTNYVEFKNWECTTDFGNNCIIIRGDLVFGHLKHEAGVHRVQRVPETEKSGRIHTSTCSVIVLPLPENHEISINEKDLIIEKMKSSGPGGQNVNKRETCIRIKHIPSGITVENQTSRYQYENLKDAILKLRTILFNNEQKKISLERNTLKKDQVGFNDYTDKIRTYHYPQNRITDHRLNYTIQNLSGFLSGEKELDYFIRQLIEVSKRKQLLSHINQTLNSEDYKNFERQRN